MIGHKFKDRLKLQRLDKEVEDYPDGTPAMWETVWKGKGLVRPKKSDELVEGQRLDAQVTHIVIIRQMSSILVDSKMRFLIDDETRPDVDKRKLYIDGVFEIEEKRRFLHCACIEAIRKDGREIETLTTWTWCDDSNHDWIDSTDAEFFNV